MISAQLQGFKTASLYLVRNKRRTLLSLIIVAIAIFALTAAAGFGLFTYQSLERSTANDVGHITLSQPGYFEREEEMPLQNGIAQYQTLNGLLSQTLETKGIQPRIYFSGLISNGRKSSIFVGNGVEPSEFVLREDFIGLQTGSALTESSEDGIMIANELANNLSVRVGDWVTLLATTTDGVLNAMDFQVVGTYSTGVPELDKRQIHVRLSSAQSLLASDKVSAVSIYLNDTRLTDSASIAVTKALDSDPAFANLQLTPWYERAFFYNKVRGLYNGIFGVLGIVLGLVVFVALFNTMSMTVSERTREIGALSAMGSYPREIIAMFVRESILIGMVGSVAGALFAWFTTLFLQVANIQMPPPPGRSEGYPLELVFSLNVATYAGIAVIIICVFAAFISARKGTKRPITEALAYV
ncbi:ABC transporter permease [Vibrio sp. 10N]|uniref:ABC transporter permease n=1 Tax=Vibrio sp. 10N TaxID=3058938 RepID=UPI002813F3BC|nr:ABC transporter permease [Vibrio sp. 10N]